MENNRKTKVRLIIGIIIVLFLTVILKQSAFSNQYIFISQNKKRAFFQDKILLSQLSEREQDAAYGIYVSIAEGQKEAKVSLAFDQDTIRRILFLIKIECPELMNFNWASRIWTQYINLIPVYRYLELEYYCVDREEYKKIEKQIKKEKENLLDSIKNKSDEEKEEIIYRYIVGKISTTDDTCKDTGSVMNLVINGVKDGGSEALAFKYFLDAAGIKNYIVPSDLNFWNSVYIKGKFRDVDVDYEKTDDGEDNLKFRCYNVCREKNLSKGRKKALLELNIDYPCWLDIKENFDE